MHVQMRQALSTSARHRQHTSAHAAQHVASFALDGRCFDELAPQLAALSLGQIGLPARAAHAPPMPRNGVVCALKACAGSAQMPMPRRQAGGTRSDKECTAYMLGTIGRVLMAETAIQFLERWREAHVYAELRALEQLDETVAECIGAAAEDDISADDLRRQINFGPTRQPILSCRSTSHHPHPPLSY